MFNSRGNNFAGKGHHLPAYQASGRPLDHWSEPRLGRAVNEELKDALRQLAAQLEKVGKTMRLCHTVMTQVDAVKRHDELIYPLSEEMVALLSEPTDCAREALQQSLAKLTEAHKHLDGLLKGESKDRYVEPLMRRIRSGETLMSEFDLLSNDFPLPNTPHGIRTVAMQVVAKQLLTAATMAEQAERNNPDAFADILGDLEFLQEALRLHVELINRWKQTPSRRLAHRFEPCVGRLAMIAKVLTADIGLLDVRLWTLPNIDGSAGEPFSGVTVIRGLPHGGARAEVDAARAALEAFLQQRP